jgi:hypothetical protein
VRLIAQRGRRLEIVSKRDEVLHRSKPSSKGTPVSNIRRSASPVVALASTQTGSVLCAHEHEVLHDPFHGGRSRHVSCFVRCMRSEPASDTSRPSFVVVLWLLGALATSCAWTRPGRAPEQDEPVTNLDDADASTPVHQAPPPHYGDRVARMRDAAFD